MTGFETVLNAKAAIMVKGLTDRRMHAVGKNLSSIIIIGGVTLGTFLLVREFTSYLLQRIHLQVDPLHQLISMALFAFFLAVHTVSLLVSYATLFTSREVEFLMGLPITEGQVFLARMFENVVGSTATLSLLGLAALLGYGSAFRLGWLDYLAVMFCVYIPFVAIAGVLGVMLMMFLILSARRFGTRTVGLVALLVYAGAAAWYFGVSEPMHLIREAMRASFDFSPAVAGSDLLSRWWLPNEWFAGFLQALVMHNAAGIVANAAAMNVLAWLVVGGAIGFGGKWYYHAWLASSEIRMQRGRTAHRVRIRLLEFSNPWTSRPQAEVVLKRDFWMFVRDPVQRLHFVMMSVITLVMLFSLRSIDFPGMNPASRALVFLTVFLFQGFLVASLALRFIYPAVSLEGKAFWAVRSAPISLSRLYWMKFAAACVTTIVPAELLVLVCVPSMRGHLESTALAAVAMASAVVAMVSLNLGAGAYFATLSEENPVKVASSQGASVTFLGSIIVLLLIAGIMAFPLVNVFSFPLAGRTAGSLVLAEGVIVALGAGVALVANALGLKSIRKDS